MRAFAGYAAGSEVTGERPSARYMGVPRSRNLASGIRSAQVQTLGTY